MKKKRSLLAAACILFALFLGAGMSGCGGSGDDSGDTGQDNAAEQTDGTDDGPGRWKIGYNKFGSGSYVLDTLANNSKVVFDTFGGDAVLADNEFSVEKIIQDYENQITAGVQGLLVWCPVETMYPTIIEMCEEAQIPFVFNDKVPADPAIKEQVINSPMFAGAVGPANDVYGQRCAQYALDHGLENCLIVSGEMNDPTDTPKLLAFREVFEGGGGTVLSDPIYGLQTEMQQLTENALSKYPNPDFIYGTGSDFGNGAADALNNKGFDTVVVTSGLDMQTLERLNDPDSPMVMVVGDNWVSGYFSAILLQNRLDGEPILDSDGKAFWFDQIMPFELPSEQYELFKKFFIDEFMYTQDEIRQMNRKLNPDFGYDELMAAINDFSVESRLKARYDEGKITAEELEAAGISAE